MFCTEGTLGLVTAATLKLVPIPEYFSTATVAFGSVEDAAEAVYGIIGSGLEPAALELLHRDNIEWMNEDAGTNFVVAPSLMMEFRKSEAILRLQILPLRTPKVSCGLWAPDPLASHPRSITLHLLRLAAFKMFLLLPSDLPGNIGRNLNLLLWLRWSLG